MNDTKFYTNKNSGFAHTNHNHLNNDLSGKTCVVKHQNQLVNNDLSGGLQIVERKQQLANDAIPTVKINEPSKLDPIIVQKVKSLEKNITIINNNVINIARQMQPKVYFGLDVFTQTQKSICSSGITNSFINIYSYYYGLDKEEQIKISYPFIIYNFRVDTYHTPKNNVMEATIRRYENNVFDIEGYDEKNIYYITVNTDSNLVTYYYKPKTYVTGEILNLF